MAEVGLGTLQAAGGVAEMAVGVVAATSSSVTVAGAVAGGYVIAHGAGNTAGGFSRIINGFKGSKAGDTANFVEQGFKAVGAENVYHGADFAIALICNAPQCQDTIF